MQGFGIMLKAMGIDPQMMQEQAQALIGDVVKRVEERFNVLEEKIDRIEMCLCRLDENYIPKVIEDQVSPQETEEAQKIADASLPDMTAESHE